MGDLEDEDIAELEVRDIEMFTLLVCTAGDIW
jgi:hypothetical protein